MQQQTAAERRRLTAREREVLALLARGLWRSEIGAALGLKPGTVGSYLSRIYDKLGVDHREAALEAARARGDL